MDMALPDPNERRRHTRLRFPARLRPTVTTGDVTWPIADLSESGFVFITRDMRYRLRQHCFGSVRFADGEVIPVEFEILRMKVDRVIVRCLIRVISSERIEKEQRRIAQWKSARGNTTVVRAPRL